MFFKDLFKTNLQKNKEIYEMYLQSKIAKSLDTVDTTYKTYQSNMNLFLKWFHEQDKGYYLLDKKMLNEFPEIIDRYAIYCLTPLYLIRVECKSILEYAVYNEFGTFIFNQSGM